MTKVHEALAGSIALLERRGVPIIIVVLVWMFFDVASLNTRVTVLEANRVQGLQRIGRLEQQQEVAAQVRVDVAAVRATQETMLRMLEAMQRERPGLR